MNGLTLGCDVGFPTARLLVIADALESALSAATRPAILAVLRLVCRPQIVTLIVQPIVVDVVNSFLSENHNVHVNLDILAVNDDSPFSIKVFAFVVCPGTPLPLVKKIKISVVNQRKLALCEGNSFHFLFA